MTKVDEPGNNARLKSLRDPKIKAGVITSNFSSSTLTFTRGNFARISGLAGFDRGTKTFGPADVRAIKMAMLAEKNHFPPEAPPPPVVMVVRNAKGGTGKTTVVGNVATALALMGYKVLCIDGDAQGNLTNMLGIDGRDASIRHIGHLILKMSPPTLTDAFIEDAIRPIFPDNMLDIIPADITLSGIESFLMSQTVNRETMVERILTQHNQVFGRYDVIFLDSASDSSSLQYNLMVASDVVLAPVKPEPISFQSLELLTSNINEIRTNIPRKTLPLEIVLNNVDLRYSHVEGHVRNLIQKYGAAVNMATIPARQDFDRNYNIFDAEFGGGPAAGTVVEQFPNRDASTAIFDLTHSLLSRYPIRLGGIEGSLLQKPTGTTTNTPAREPRGGTA